MWYGSEFEGGGGLGRDAPGAQQRFCCCAPLRHLFAATRVRLYRRCLRVRRFRVVLWACAARSRASRCAPPPRRSRSASRLPRRGWCAAAGAAGRAPLPRLRAGELGEPCRAQRAAAPSRGSSAAARETSRARQVRQQLAWHLCAAAGSGSSSLRSGGLAHESSHTRAHARKPAHACFLAHARQLAQELTAREELARQPARQALARQGCWQDDRSKRVL
jgi:hypothetical protein